MMSEDKNEIELSPENTESQQKEKLKFSFFQFISTLWESLKSIMNIKEGTDIQGTIDGIKKDIDFRGYNVWILIFSIFIASIGLNLNSTAVIIGAMLISPLMGPILGVGLSVGINDWQTLIRSLKSFGVMIVISIATSWFYFLITPLDDVTPELLARTKPTLPDAFIAIFGGLAGIIAGSRKEKTNVIPGVAIATALMPPLCTAGFGLATGNFNFFFGAFYLFFINSVFISITTVIVVRFLLKFPLKKQVSAEKQKKVQLYMTIFILAVLIPSGINFFDVVKESLFNNRANQFISENFVFEGTEIVTQKMMFTDSTNTIEIFLIGDQISQNEIKNLKNKLPYYGLENTKLKIHQNKDNSSELAGAVTEKVRSGIIEEMYEKNAELLEDKERHIRFLEREIIRLKKDSIPFIALEKEIKANYLELQEFSFAKAYATNFSKKDTVPLVLVKWQPSVSEKQAIEYNKRLANYLKVRLNLDTIQIIEKQWD